MDHTYSRHRTPARLLLARDRPCPRDKLTDADLVSASSRDPEAFTGLFERYWDDIYRFCQSRAGSAVRTLRRSRSVSPSIVASATTLVSAMPPSAVRDRHQPVRDHFRRSGARSIRRPARGFHALARGDAELTGWSDGCWERSSSRRCRVSRRLTSMPCCCRCGRTLITSRSLRRSTCRWARCVPHPPCTDPSA